MQPDLMARFGFDEEDLAANKSGSLSTTQKQLFQRDNRGFYISLVFLSIAALVGAAELVPIALHPATRLPILTWGGVIALVLLAIGLIGSLFTQMNYRVEKVRGPAHLEKVLILRGETEALDIWSHEFIVNQLTFHVVETTFQVLRQGDVYAVYYAKHLRQILSVEHIT